jgi:chaperone modulatory protein CbpM
MITEREFLEEAHLDSGTLEVWIRQEWIVPARAAADRSFTDMDLARARLIGDLKHNMGVNDEGLDVILHLIDQMHGLRKALADALASIHEQTPRRNG